MVNPSSIQWLETLAIVGDFTAGLPILTCLVHGLVPWFRYIAHIAATVPSFIYTAILQYCDTLRRYRSMHTIAKLIVIVETYITLSQGTHKNIISCTQALLRINIIRNTNL